MLNAKLIIRNGQTVCCLGVIQLAGTQHTPPHKNPMINLSHFNMIPVNQHQPKFDIHPSCVRPPINYANFGTHRHLSIIRIWIALKPSKQYILDQMVLIFATQVGHRETFQTPKRPMTSCTQTGLHRLDFKPRNGLTITHINNKPTPDKIHSLHNMYQIMMLFTLSIKLQLIRNKDFN